MLFEYTTEGVGRSLTRTPVGAEGAEVTILAQGLMVSLMDIGEGRGDTMVAAAAAKWWL